MFPLVLPTPLSKKWGAKLTWAREKTDRTNGHPETRRAISRQHGLMSGPSSGQAGTLLSNPSTPMFRLGSLGEGPLAQACQGHGPSGALRTQAAAKLSSSISRVGPGAREVVSWPRSHQELGRCLLPHASIRDAANPPTLFLRKEEVSGGPGPKSGVSSVLASGEVPREPLSQPSQKLEESPPSFLLRSPSPSWSLTLEVNSPELCLCVPPGSAGTHPRPHRGPRRPAATHPSRGAAAPGLGRPAGRASCLRGRVTSLLADEVGRRSTEHAPGPGGAQR